MPPGPVAPGGGPAGAPGGRDPGCPAVEEGGLAPPGTVGAFDGRPAGGGVDVGRVDGPGVEPPTFGVLEGRDGVPVGPDLGSGVLAPPRTFGVLDGLLGVPLGDPERGGALLLELLTLGPVLPSPLPDWLTLAAFDWSVDLAACAVSLTFCPVVSEDVAACSAPALAVLMASSALSIATWPNTPALCDDAPMLSLPPTPSRIWLPRPENRLLIDSTASGSMLEPLPGAIPPAPGPDWPGVPDPLDPPLCRDGPPEEPDEPDEPDEPEEPWPLRVIGR